MIPTANGLFVFEAAARHESFKEAARELNVTQPAITHAIRQLEQRVGVRLFHRRHRGVELTGDGKTFYRDVRSGFDIILQSVLSLQHEDSDETVTISISTSMASLWLFPRLADFRRDHPNVEIRFQAVDRDIDPSRENVDLTIRLGDGDWPGLDSWRFIDEEVFPVCSPKYLEDMPSPKDIEDLSRHHLLHLQEPYRVRLGWNGWTQALGCDLHFDHGDVFTDAQMLYQAAIEGQGICLGWAGLTETPMRQGLLVRPLKQSHRTGQAFFIVASKDKPIPAQARALRDWMLEKGNHLRAD